MKRNKNKVILSSIVVLLPMVIGLLIWNQLPKDVATHFSFNGQPDGYSSKEFAVFVLPLIIFVMHIFCIFAVNADPKSKNINNKMYSIILWICPLVSVFICNCIYGYTLGFIKNIGFITGLLLGTLYIALGNYLPTVKPNYTVGIRVPWTLNDQDNWYHTHRFSGKMYGIRWGPTYYAVTFYGYVYAFYFSSCTRNLTNYLFLFISSKES